jgi:chromate transport protein ChrA
MKPLFWRMMLISVLSWVGSIAVTPVLKRDTFEAGEPISEKEFSNAILSKAAGKFHLIFLFCYFPGG